jgi:hypothetical protein
MRSNQTHTLNENKAVLERSTVSVAANPHIHAAQQKSK